MSYDFLIAGSVTLFIISLITRETQIGKHNFEIERERYKKIEFVFLYITRAIVFEFLI